MNESLITVRYVKALYELALESKLLEEVEKDMLSLQSVINESKEFNDFIKIPTIKISEKLKMIDTLFKGKLNKISIQFLHLLIKNNREIYLKRICLHFISYYKQNQGIKEAVITTAIPLSETHKNEIYAFITKKFKVNIELTEKVDPSIIGGFVLRIGDQQINASIHAQLNKIRRELIHT